MPPYEDHTAIQITVDLSDAQPLGVVPDEALEIIKIQVIIIELSVIQST